METQQLKEGDRVSEWDLYRQKKRKSLVATSTKKGVCDIRVVYPKQFEFKVLEENDSFILKIEITHFAQYFYGSDLLYERNNIVTETVKICKHPTWKIKNLNKL